MGYIPPLHYSAYNHYVSQKNGFVLTPFMFTKVQKVKLFKENQTQNAKKVSIHYEKLQFDVLKNFEDDSAQKIISEMTGIGRIINVLI